MVERKPSREDRRQVEIHLLPYGLELVARIAELHKEEVKMLRQEFSLPGWEPLD